MQKNTFTVEHADRMIAELMKILEDRHNVKITYRIVERDKEDDKENN